MLVSKSFLITGDTTHKAGPDGQVRPTKNIAEKVDATINQFLRGLAGATLIDIKPNVQIGSTQDQAFITIIVDVPEEKPEEPKVASRPKK